MREKALPTSSPQVFGHLGSTCTRWPTSSSRIGLQSNTAGLLASQELFIMRPDMLDAIVHAQAEDLVPLRKNPQNFCHLQPGLAQGKDSRRNSGFSLALVLALHDLHSVTGHDLKQHVTDLKDTFAGARARSCIL